jgi:hypothetical protein
MPGMQKPAVMRDNSNGYQLNAKTATSPTQSTATTPELGFDVEEKEGRYIKSHTEMVSHC